MKRKKIDWDRVQHNFLKWLDARSGTWVDRATLYEKIKSLVEKELSR